MASDSTGVLTPSSRTASREVRRQQLIDATIAVLASKGYASLTVADVARGAGLSVGIVDFHFGGKQELLAETLRFLAQDYQARWQGALAAAGSDPANRLKALLLNDFDPAVYTPQRLAAWIAFWGEAQGRPLYDQICAAFDHTRLAATSEICGTLIKDGGYPLTAPVVAQALEALSDGLWYGMVSETSRSSGEALAKRAETAVLSVLGAYFPKHFKESS